MPGAASSNFPIVLGFGLAVGAVAVGVWGAKGTRGLNGLGGQRTVRRPRQLRGHVEQSELKLFIDNDGQLYRSQTTSIIKNLATKMAKGVYDRAKAEKLWGYLAEAGAKKYSKESGSGGTWHNMFDVADRRAVARELNDDFLAEWKNGSYRDLLPKKYAGA